MTHRACFTIREHEYLYRGLPQSCADGCYIEDSDFDALKQLLVPASMLDEDEELDGSDEEMEEASRRIFRLRNHKSEEVLQVRNFVGVIQTPTGQQIEILPKVGMSSSDARGKLLHMLRVARYVPAARAYQAGLSTVDAPLHALFVREFLASVSAVVRRGIVHGYSQIHTNHRYLKGRLLVDKNIRHNAHSPERFYVAYEHFTPDRPENRLIRTAIEVAMDLTDDDMAQRTGRELRFAFEDVPLCEDVAGDFGSCVKDRSAAHYADALAWAKLILLGMAPLGADGKLKASALLFPMERVFEKFVGQCIDRTLPSALKVELQVERRSLVRHGSKRLFKLRPDFLVSYGGLARCVLDAKWKTVYASDEKNRYGLSQADLYQVYAYGHKYLDESFGERHVCLIYPGSDTFVEPLNTFEFEVGFTLHVLPLDIDSGQIRGAAAILKDLLPRELPIDISVVDDA
jgi:5-methylcytosine-specific restriction enzyme subunit McrC